MKNTIIKKREKFYFLLNSNGTVVSKFFYGKDAAIKEANKILERKNHACVVTQGEIIFKDFNF